MINSCPFSRILFGNTGTFRHPSRCFGQGRLTYVRGSLPPIKWGKPGLCLRSAPAGSAARPALRECAIGSKMVSPGVGDDQQTDDLIAYRKQFGPDSMNVAS
jgi:hypothetical protein